MVQNHDSVPLLGFLLLSRPASGPPGQAPCTDHASEVVFLMTWPLSRRYPKSEGEKRVLIVFEAPAPPGQNVKTK